MAFADNFKSKKELARDKYQAEADEWTVKINIMEDEILEGAPTRDFAGVRKLKSDLDEAYRKRGIAERTVMRLNQEMDQAGVK